MMQDFEDAQICPDDVWMGALPIQTSALTLHDDHCLTLAGQVEKTSQDNIFDITPGSSTLSVSSFGCEESLMTFLEQPLLFEEVAQLIAQDVSRNKQTSSAPVYTDLDNCRDCGSVNAATTIATTLNNNSSNNNNSTRQCASPLDDFLTSSSPRSTSPTMSVSDMSFVGASSPAYSGLGSDGEDCVPSPMSDNIYADGSAYGVVNDVIFYQPITVDAARIGGGDSNLKRTFNNFADISSDISSTRSQTRETIADIPRRKRKGRHLWEFLLDVLSNSDYNPSLIRWIDKAQGLFKIEKSQEVARLWGSRKAKNKMSYEYMSRAMRHYYSNGILQRVYGKRLVYQFGHNAIGWQDSARRSP